MSAGQWTRDGRCLHLDGERALHLERSKDANNYAPLAPWQVDSLARQLFRALQSGAIRVPECIADLEVIEGPGYLP